MNESFPSVLRVRLGVVVSVALLATLPVLAQEGLSGGSHVKTPIHSLKAPANFGTGLIETVLSAAEFHPQGDATYAYSGTGYINRSGGTSTAFWAPINLPNGALVTELCVWYNNTSGTTPFVEWSAYGYGTGTTAPIYHEFNQFDLPNVGGYNVACIFPNTTIHAFDDLNGDATFEWPGYRVAVYLDQADASQQLGGIYLGWYRQVSPAPGSATFGDVPPSHPFFQYIEALAAAGITAGCGGGNFCPDQPITRKQEAAFISKALGLHWQN